MYLKKGILLILLCCIIINSGCKKDKQSDINIPTNDILDNMVKAASSLPDMKTVNSSDENASNNFSYICDFDYSKIEEYTFTYSKEGKADEICVIKLKDKNDTSELKDCLKERITSRTNTYKTYNPKEAKTASNGLVISNENYASLIITTGASEVENAFYKSF